MKTTVPATSSPSPPLLSTLAWSLQTWWESRFIHVEVLSLFSVPQLSFLLATGEVSTRKWRLQITEMSENPVESTVSHFHITSSYLNNPLLKCKCKTERAEPPCWHVKYSSDDRKTLLPDTDWHLNPNITKICKNQLKSLIHLNTNCVSVSLWHAFVQSFISRQRFYAICIFCV